MVRLRLGLGLDLVFLLVSVYAHVIFTIFGCHCTSAVRNSDENTPGVDLFEGSSPVPLNNLTCWTFSCSDSHFWLECKDLVNGAF